MLRLRAWLIFAIVTTGTFMINVDMSVLNVALPTLQAEFHTRLETLSWVIVAYLMIITGTLPLIGKLSDLYGRKPFFIAGVTLFGGFAALAALAKSLPALIVYRLGMGIGSALIQANVMSIVADTFPPGERGRPMGMIGSVVAVGTIVGPAIGGFLLHYFGWPAIFWINVPFSLLAAAGAWVFLENRRPAPPSVVREQIDVLGATYFLIAVSALMQGLNGLSRLSFFSAPSLAAFGTSALFWVLYIVRSLRVPEPLIHLGLFRIPTFAVGNATGLLSYVLIGFPQIVLPYYLHLVHGYTSDRIGLVITAQAVAMIVASTVAGGLADRRGTRLPSLIGLAVSAAAFGVLALLGPGTPVGFVVAGLALFGVGMGFFQPPNNVAVLESVPKEATGLTGGIIATVRNLGRVLGVAVATFLFDRVGGPDGAAEAVVGVRVVMLVGLALSLFAWGLTFAGQGQRHLAPARKL
ncbi:MAG: MFS transporter [Hydrogenibacillus schlegelii]|nr:MFS transporter [Hydrogenibacillus schlegelii]